MANPGINDVSLMGPNTALPADIQAAMARQALSQKIAEELLRQSMVQDPSIIHTGGANPFARDVPNIGGPLAKLFQAYAGQGLLSDSQNAQLGLAGMALQRRQAEQGAADQPLLSASPTPAMQAIAAAGQATTPAIQDQRSGLMDAMVKGLLARQATPESAASTFKGGISPDSYAKSIGTDPLFGTQTTDPSQYQQKLVPNVVGPAQTPVLTNPNPTGATPGPGASVTTLPVPTPRIIKAGDPLPGGGTSQVDMEVKPDGSVGVLAGNPATKSLEVAIKDKQDALDTSQQNIQNFNKFLPQAAGMMKLVQTARQGITADWVNNAQQYAMALGVANDDVGKIVDTQTLIKYATPAATAALHDISSRPALMEWQNQMLTSAADPKVDPRAAQNVYRKMIIEGLNTSGLHQHKMALAEGLLSPAVLKSYAAETSPEDVFRTMNQIAPDTPFNIQQTKNGTWFDAGLGTAESHAMPGQKAPKGSGATLWINPKTKKVEPIPGPISGTVDSQGNDVTVAP